MKGRRTTISMIAVVPILWCVGATAAQANPLLSGYGGPGDGSQAILGAQLFNGPTSGGGPSAGGGASSSAGAREGSSASGAGRGGARAGRRGRGAGRARSTHSGAPATGLRGGLSARQAASERPSEGFTAIGLSGGDLLLVLVAFAVLAFTGALTALLARRPPSGYGG